MISKRALMSLVVLLCVGVIAPLSVTTTRAVGPALYPDLRNTPPSGLYFDRRVLSDGLSHYVLRFSNTVWNAGEGRLEIQGDPNPNGSNTIYQNIYDARYGGNRVIQRQVSADLLYHPSHYHYHFLGFARYQLLKRDAAGVYQTTSLRSNKTSYCVMDTYRLTSSAGYSIYSSCGNRLQGLTVGWGDQYPSSLPDQWIDLGTSPLPNGYYAVKSTADPDNKLSEAGRDSNNVGITYFTVSSGRITLGRAPFPSCTRTPASVTVGATLTLTCSGFRAGEIVKVHLDSTSTTPLTSVTASSSGTFTKSLTVPEMVGGNHTLILVGGSGSGSPRLSFTLKPSVSRSPSGGPPGSAVTVTVRGFGASETVKLNWNSPSGTTLARLTTSTRGTGSARILIPNDTVGWHDYTAYGYTSQLRAYGAIEVLAGYPPGTANPSFSGEKLAIWSSSGTSNANSPSRVYDGSTTTSWETSSTTPSSAAFTLDLGRTVQMSGVRWLYSQTGSADEVLIQTSLDGSTWRTVGRYGNAPANAW
ncbi:MAG: lysyl oxidase family protein, partial [Chloroflexota bacterium]|nr:lysyl oxidase family protein [Chloroflexota bacterium]